VIFVGTGPGDPDLLTLGAIAALADASTVIM
jgi:uroporphyrinogen III methyltransferase/synthase